ncbi:MAG: hypothetical protein PHH75_08560, partial [Candidatus Omnitrophica bacterium]|nr:hypothetical protein [Candidatus Omnitrophota bacterium]
YPGDHFGRRVLDKTMLARLPSGLRAAVSIEFDYYSSIDERREDNEIAAMTRDIAEVLKTRNIAALALVTASADPGRGIHEYTPPDQEAFILARHLEEFRIVPAAPAESSPASSFGSLIFTGWPLMEKLYQDLEWRMTLQTGSPKLSRFIAKAVVPSVFEVGLCVGSVNLGFLFWFNGLTARPLILTPEMFAFLFVITAVTFNLWRLLYIPYLLSGLFKKENGRGLFSKERIAAVLSGLIRNHKSTSSELIVIPWVTAAFLNYYLWNFNPCFDAAFLGSFYGIFILPAMAIKFMTALLRRGNGVLPPPAPADSAEAAGGGASRMPQGPGASDPISKDGLSSPAKSVTKAGGSRPKVTAAECILDLWKNRDKLAGRAIQGRARGVMVVEGEIVPWLSKNVSHEHARKLLIVLERCGLLHVVREGRPGVLASPAKYYLTTELLNASREQVDAICRIPRLHEGPSRLSAKRASRPALNKIKRQIKEILPVCVELEVSAGQRRPFIRVVLTAESRKILGFVMRSLAAATDDFAGQVAEWLSGRGCDGIKEIVDIFEKNISSAYLLSADAGQITPDLIANTRNHYLLNKTTALGGFINWCLSDKEGKKRLGEKNIRNALEALKEVAVLFRALADADVILISQWNGNPKMIAFETIDVEMSLAYQKMTKGGSPSSPATGVRRDARMKEAVSLKESRGIKIVGITGFMGSGKTTVSGILKEEGYAVISGDFSGAGNIAAPRNAAARVLVNIVKYAVSLTPAFYALHVFLSSSLRRRMTYRHLAETLSGWKQGDGGHLFVDSANLYQLKLERLLDEVWYVSRDEEERRRALLERERGLGLSSSTAARYI